MGSCASLYGRSAVVKAPPPPETVTDKFEIPPSPIKHFKLQTNTESAIKDISVVSHHKTPSGSKEEAFFDSRAWLDSDCDDFFSVKGDFTPSCGSTPLHHRFPAETPRASGGDDQLPTVKSPPLPAKRRKKLVELFRESLGGDASFAFLNSEENPPEDLTNGKVDEPCVSGAASVCSSGRTTAGAGTELGDEKAIGFGSKLCCLPALVSRHSSSERKEDLKASAMAVNGVS
ncbi:uncharacterized protein At3g27210 isoform X2 [Momordica charantia]|uniref:Uncharacterized protein At3g27210 isoform X2 n=1 Tax=Momordica charantia TaxID=3673 RepID=A0A6J1BVV8_MOMCH|nr:uncharacterized protein At3g27210 isoform X2 [Momordica charantia]